MLNSAAASVADPDLEKGCMIASGMIVSNPQNFDLQREIAERRSEFRIVLQRKLTTWVSDDEALRLARYLTAAMQGISIPAHDGASKNSV